MLRIAFSSSDGQIVDQHFGMTDRFYVWEVGPEQARLLEVRAHPEAGEETEDKITARAELLADCAIVYTLQIGGPAAAKLVRRHVHPLKTTIPTPILTVVGRLQEVLRGRPPPWLAKAMLTTTNRASSASNLEDPT